MRRQSALGNIKGILNCTPSYNKLIVSFDLEITNFQNVFDFINSANFSDLDIKQDMMQYNVR